MHLELSNFLAIIWIAGTIQTYMVAGAEAGEGRLRGFARRANAIFTAAPKRVAEKVSTGFVDRNKRSEEVAEFRSSLESAYTNLGRDDEFGVTKTQIVTVLRAESALVRLGKSDLTPAGKKVLANSNIRTTPGQDNTANFLIARGAHFELEAKKLRSQIDKARKNELLRRAQACRDAAVLIQPPEKLKAYSE